MVLQAVNSKTISKVGYDPQTLIMIIEFHTGSMYEFSGVDQDIYQQFINSPSLGTFFSKNLRKKFQYKKIM